MGPIYNITQVAQSIVLYPSVASVLVLFVTSFINELFGLVPYTILLSGQMFFVGVPLSIPLIIKTFVFVALPVSFGTAFGSLLIYGAGFWGGKPAIEKFGKPLHLSWESVMKVKSQFKGSWYDELLFLALRSVPFIPGLPVSAAAGIVRMRMSIYLSLTALGSMIKIMLMCILVGLGTQVIII